MKNVVANLYCRKSLLLVLTLLFSAGQGYAAGKTTGQLPQLAVSSLSDVISPQHLDMSKWPLFRLGILSLAGGGLVMLMGDMAQSLWFTGLGSVLTTCGVVFCVGKVISSPDAGSKEVKINGDEIVIYDNDGDYQLGHIIGAESYYPSSMKVVSADGMQDTVEAKQIKHVVDLSDKHFKTLDKLLVQHLLRDGDVESMKLLVGAVIAFKHNDKNYLDTVSGVKITDDGRVELIIESSSRRKVVISIDSKGKPVLDGDLRGDLKAVIFLP